MRVLMPDVQASNQVYAHPQNLPITGSWIPTQNGTVCASLASTGGIDCGVVREDWFTYLDVECWCLIDGADHDNITTEPGDSGSPIYSQGSSWLTAIGLHSTAFGYFARVEDLLIHWNSNVVGG
jgi:hypothetical protein